MAYTEMKTCPDYETAIWANGELLNKRLGTPLWSNKAAPPAIGTTVQAITNRIGPCKVVGYATMDGWLGVMVEVLDPPAWWLKQNGTDTSGVLFGAEISIPN